MSKTIGIHFGATECQVAIANSGETEVIPNAEGSRSTPSVVAIFPENGVLVGSLALRLSTTNAENTTMSVRDHLGDPTWEFWAGGQVYSSVEIASHLFRKLKRDSEEFLGFEISQAVISVPAHFNDLQRQDTIEAGSLAGLDTWLIDEQEAIVRAHIHSGATGQTFLVFSLDSTSTDASLVRIEEDEFHTLSTVGNTAFGTNDWIEAVSRWLIEEFEYELGISLRFDMTALQRIQDATERALEELVSVSETNFDIPFIAADESGPLHLDSILSRKLLSQLTEHLLRDYRELIIRSLKAGIDESIELDQVITSGSGSKIPGIQELIEEMTGLEIGTGVSPEEAIAIGASIGPEAGLRSHGEAADVGMGVNSANPMTLSYVLGPSSISNKLIDRNCSVPSSRTIFMATQIENPTQFTLEIFQGDEELPEKEMLLNRFEFTGIPEKWMDKVLLGLSVSIDWMGSLKMCAWLVNNASEKEYFTLSLAERLLSIESEEIDDDDTEEPMVSIDKSYSRQNSPDLFTEVELTLDQQVAQAQRRVMDASKRAQVDKSLRGKVPQLYRALADYTESIEEFREKQEATNRHQENLTRLLAEFENNSDDS